MSQRLQQWEWADSIMVAITMGVGVVWALLSFGIGAVVDGFSAPLPVLVKITHVIVFLPVYMAHYELTALELLIGLDQPVSAGMIFTLLAFNGALIGLLPGLLLVRRMR